ncbi:DMT family transporter [Sciscionella marina]|uniref:DMT family transporter n=1 Tax=Sciscionella marina TaxID=508770 RepID=UPI0003A8B1D9|nr:DMT family transporter [Sciscionella marina]
MTEVQSLYDHLGDPSATTAPETDLVPPNRRAEDPEASPPSTRQPDPPDSRSTGNGIAFLSVVVAALIMAASYTFTKVALRDVPPLTIGLIRFAIAAAILAVWAHWIKRYPEPSRTDRRRLALGGILGFTLYFSIENFGIELATPTDAALLVASYPALTALLDLILHRRRTPPRELAGIVLAIAGVFLVVGFNGTGGHARLLGDILLIVSGIVWALYNFATRDVAGRYPTPQIVYYQVRVGALAFVPLALIEIGDWHAPHSPTATMTSLLLLAVICSIAGMGCYAHGLTRLRPSTAVNILNLIPVFGILIAWLMVGDQVTPLQILGGAVVVLGVTVTSRK